MIPTLAQMEKSIALMFGISKCIIVPNISWGFGIHECDLLVVTKSGHATEVEIKRSVSDMKADLKKPHAHKSDKINYLYYAFPNDIIDKCSEYVPEHAGIIRVDYVDKIRYFAYVVRSAKKVNKYKLTDIEMFKVARLGAMRIWNTKSAL